MGTAFVLAAPLQLDEVRLETGAGLVPVKLERDGSRIAFGRMEQPVPTFEPYDGEAALLEGVGVERSSFHVEVYDNGLRHVYVALSSEAVAALRPNLEHLPTCQPSSGSTASPARAPGGRPDVRARQRCSEDPATSSAAGPLAVHLVRHGRIEFGDEIEISQGAEIGRPSTLLPALTARRAGRGQSTAPP